MDISDESEEEEEEAPSEVTLPEDLASEGAESEGVQGGDGGAQGSRPAVTSSARSGGERRFLGLSHGVDAV